MRNVLINIVLLLVILTPAYIFWIRPILKQRPELLHLWDREGAFFEALNLKLAGIKQRLAGAVMILAGVVVEAYNFIGPALGTVDTSGITDKMPSWAWPLLMIAAVSLLNYFRSLADKRVDEVVEAKVEEKVEARVAEAVATVTETSNA